MTNYVYILTCASNTERYSADEALDMGTPCASLAAAIKLGNAWIADMDDKVEAELFAPDEPKWEKDDDSDVWSFCQEDWDVYYRIRKEELQEDKNETQ